MFEFIRTHMRLMQFLLLLLIIPSFVFFGVSGYNLEGGGADVAVVDGRPITQVELDEAHRVQIERLRQQMPNLDAKFFDTPELKVETLEGMVRERVIEAAALKQHLATPDPRMQRLFATDPELAFLRRPDGNLNRDVLAAQNMTAEQFIQRFRRELTMRQVLQGITQSAEAPVGAADAALDAMFQQREVQILRFDAKTYAAKVTPTDAQIEAYYNDPANKALYTAPESAAIEYAVLDLASVEKTLSVSEEELRKYYEQNEARYGTPEERRARHILINAPASATADDRAKAKARAEALLEQVRKSPATFAEVATKNSQDTGSAAQGGDLDYFGRGMMVKPFEEAAYALKPGDISGLVETEYGYHIIQLEAVRGGEKKTFEQARAQVETEVKKDQAQKKYAELAEQFTNTVYEQPDSLKPALDKFKLEARSAKVSRLPDPAATGPLANSKFLDALFDAGNLQAKRNTEAIETAPNTLVSGRVVSYEPAHQKPLADVRDLIRQGLVARESAELAKKEGQARLEALKGGATDGLPPAVTVSRAQPPEAGQALLDAVLAADAGKLPAYVGVSLGDQGYAVAKVNKVLGRDPAVADAQQGRRQYAQTWAAAESAVYFEALKKRFETEVKPLQGAASAPL